MADRYEPHVIEPKWRKRWEDSNLYAARDDDARPKWYALTMFPYPSGDLHTGHWYAMAPSDVAARYRRMRGYNVMFPMGFDSFGLPAENAAIKRGIDPREWTYQNIERMRGQLRLMGAGFDWEREVITSDPEFYRWTQWWFLQFYKHGLAYQAEALANWCPGCQTVVANEQVLDGKCERSDDVVERKMMRQWFFKITAYAEELLRYDGIDWPDRIRNMQRNWIGRSEGAHLDFTVDVDGVDSPLTVFTTRPDTVYGATFMVIAPEHPLVTRVTTPEQRGAVAEYVAATGRTSEVDRLSTEHEKTGVFTGAYAVNRFNGARIPIWIADYVLVTYGTGAVMAVPAHDQRDFDFAKKYGLEVIPVYDHAEVDVTKPLAAAIPYGGRMINSGGFDGTPSSDAIRKVVEHAEAAGVGKGAVTYRLRDWSVSRQRFWGAPLPFIHCGACGTQPVPDEDLPVTLPEKVEFRPTGQSPLTLLEDWVNVPCPKCGGAAKRETDTLDTFMCSSWYQMRYVDPRNPERPFSAQAARQWFPVDQYTGGAEHAVMHLLYTRFFWKAARDMGMVEGDEPMKRLFNQGVILGPDGNRMSKSRGNVVAPDEQVEKWGADAFRCQLMFVGPWDQGGPYNPTGMSGIVRWLHRLWSLATDPCERTAAPNVEATRELRRATHKTILAATEEIENFRFNTLISRLMEHTSAMQRAREAGAVDGEAWEEALQTALLLTAPLAPHITEELWERLGHGYSIHTSSWPVADSELAADEAVEIAVQVNGKVRDRILLPLGCSEADAAAAVFALPKIQEQLGGSEPRRVIYVPGKLFSIVL
ncbi:MAG: leucine--tRNA ligase [Dehalococcoidia bacterium]|uniref:leucine--tRNA ligase n=1 Tax=Candidatus Amarobacter glycogenicus TaxID=3140699 RepID=UPI003136B79B|nr:leucine--tRNA ligase [Dehalococcoidia bacterium]